jgi:glyoxylase-like metal-dependent hydrolase (beta-lactamase superfamily II)
MSYTTTTLTAPDGAPSLVVHTHHAPEQGLAVNSYAVETPNGVFLIDAQLLRSQARQFKTVVEAIGKPVLGIFITHSHPDHYSGLEVLTGANPTVPIYATQAALEAMQQLDDERRSVWKPMFGEEYADYMVTPTHVVTAGQALVVDGVTFSVQELGLGETTDMTVLHLPTYNALFAADVVYNRVHPWLGEGHSHAWVKQIEFCMSTYADAEIVFGGHGDAGGTGIFGEYMAYLLFCRKLVKDAIARGQVTTTEHREQLKLRLMTRYPGYPLGFLLERNINGLITELSAA